jgi:hypothetical protein
MKKNNKNTLNLVFVLSLLLTLGLGCSSLVKDEGNDTKPATDSKPTSSGKPEKLDSYTLRGVKFAWYKISPGLAEDDLIAIAQKIHDQEPDTQLVLVDDDSEMADYIQYAKAISGQGEIDKPMPAEWADKHIIANVQKYMSGKFVLCEANGSKEIADLK